jgi:hypothetical protein
MITDMFHCATNDHGYVSLCHKWSRICSTCRKHFPHSRLITGFVTRLTRRVPLVEQELLTLPEHLSSPPVFSAWGSCYSIFSFICKFCRSLFVLLCFFFWPLCSLFFFNIRILITPLVSSNFSCIQNIKLLQYNILSLTSNINIHLFLIVDHSG